MQQLLITLWLLILNYLLYRSKLIPRWLSAWGFIGGLLILAEGLLRIFGFDPISICSFPIALQEMVFAVWLIVKGFDSSAIALEDVTDSISTL